MEQNIQGSHFDNNASFQKEDSKVKFGWSGKGTSEQGNFAPQEQNRIQWNQFTESTTFHGIKYIFDFQASKFRRALWVCCVLVSVGLFLVQVSARAQAYFSYKSNVHVAVLYDKELPFPAVTICNQNNFRLSKTLETGKLVYDFIDEIFSEAGIQNVKEFDIIKYNETLSKIDLKEFITTTAHQIYDLIDSCKWKGRPCNRSDFKMVYTDLGVCYSFNFDPSETKYTNISGNRGLSIVMNVEQYEYMRGPQNDAGLKIFLHHQNDTPMVKDMGFSVAPGTHTEIGINHIKKLSLESPYGDCHPDAEPLTKCMTYCKAKTAEKICGCKDLYMESTEAPICGMEKAFRCIPYALEIGEGDLRSCQCSSPCEQSLYEHSFSFATLSKFNIERVVLNDPNESLRVQRNIIHAKEMSVRNIEEVWENDKKQVEDLLNITSWITENLTALSKEWPIAFDILFMLEDMIERDKSNDFFQERKILIGCFIQGKIPDSNGHCSAQKNTSLFITNVVSYISKLQQYFFEPDNHSLLKYLENCFDRYGNFELNISLSYECPSFSDKSSNYNHTTLRSTTKTMADCRTFIQCQADSALALYNEKPEYIESIVDVVRSDVNFTKYILLLNTTRSATDLNIKKEKHATCLGRVDHLQNITSMHSMATISEMLRQFLSLRYGQLEDILIHLRNMTILFNYQQLNDSFVNVLTTCKPWVTASYCSSKMLDKRCKLKFTDDLMQTIFQQYIDVRKSSKKLQNHWIKLVPVLKDLSKYIDGNLTKANIAEVFLTSQEMANNLLKKSELVGQLIFDMTTVTEMLPEIESEVMAIYTEFYLGYEGNLNEKLRSALEELGVFDFDEDFETGFEYLLKTFFRKRQNSLQDFIQFLEEEAEGLFDTSMNNLKGNLLEYAEDVMMDEDFFMANFLQVDIFYKELKYQKIEQQVAFSLISLFSEVGGFLGLLLGASVLTVCELLDYIALIIISRMQKIKSTKVTAFENKNQSLRNPMN